jgi:hypothetical protein
VPQCQLPSVFLLVVDALEAASRDLRRRDGGRPASAADRVHMEVRRRPRSRFRRRGGRRDRSAAGHLHRRGRGRGREVQAAHGGAGQCRE